MRFTNKSVRVAVIATVLTLLADAAHGQHQVDAPALVQSKYDEFANVSTVVLTALALEDCSVDSTEVSIRLTGFIHHDNSVEATTIFYQYTGVGSRSMMYSDSAEIGVILLLDGERVRIYGAGTRNRTDKGWEEWIAQETNVEGVEHIASASSARIRMYGPQLVVDCTFSEQNKRDLATFVKAMVDARSRNPGEETPI